MIGSCCEDLARVDADRKTKLAGITAHVRSGPAPLSAELDPDETHEVLDASDDSDGLNDVLLLFIGRISALCRLLESEHETGETFFSRTGSALVQFDAAGFVFVLVLFVDILLLLLYSLAVKLAPPF